MCQCKCGRKFEKISSLNSHARFCKKYEKTKNKIKNENYSCECGKIFEKPQSLNAHFSRCKIHRGENYKKRTEDPFRFLTKERVSEIHQKGGAKLKNRPLSQEHREAISKGIKTSPNKHNIGGYREGTNKWRGGYILDRDNREIRLDSSWEIKFVQLLNNLNIKWDRNYKHFPYEFDNSKKRYYPDFFLPELNIWIEIKGREVSRDLAKWKYFPNELSVIRGKDLKELENIYELEIAINLIKSLKINGPMSELVYEHA